MEVYEGCFLACVYRESKVLSIVFDDDVDVVHHDDDKTDGNHLHETDSDDSSDGENDGVLDGDVSAGIDAVNRAIDVLRNSNNSTEGMEPPEELISSSCQAEAAANSSPTEAMKSLIRSRVDDLALKSQLLEVSRNNCLISPVASINYTHYGL